MGVVCSTKYVWTIFKQSIGGIGMEFYTFKRGTVVAVDFSLQIGSEIRFATPLPSSLPSLITTCGSLRLAVNTQDWSFTS